MITSRNMSETKAVTQHIGYWRQDKAGKDVCNLDAFVDLPWPGDFIDKTWDPVEQETVARYLDAAPDVQHCFGESFCRLGCEDDDLRMGCSDKSDGVYTWPEGFSHYIRKHKVKPPKEFIDHVLRKQQGDWRIVTTLISIDWDNLKSTFEKALNDALAQNPGWVPVLSEKIEIQFFVGDLDALWGGDHLMEVKAIDVFGMYHRLELFERALNLQASLLYREKTGKRPPLGPPFNYMRDLEENGIGRPTLAQIRFKVQET